MIAASKRHLADVDEAYAEHLGEALGIAALLIGAGLACAVHAIIPGLCTRTASRCVARFQARMDARGAAATAQTRRAPISDERGAVNEDLTASPRPIFSS